LAEAATEMLRAHQDVLPVRTASRTPALILIDRILQVPKELWRQTLIREVMETFNRYIKPSEPLNTLFEQLATSRSGALPMGEEGEPVGVLRMSDLSQAAALKVLKELLQEPVQPSEPPEGRKKAA
jgi:CBS-domain-containing membrane protein